MTKLTNWHMRPVKTQIILGIRPVWFESLLCAQWVTKHPRFLHADREESHHIGQAHMPFRWFCHAHAHIYFFRALLSLWVIRRRLHIDKIHKNKTRQSLPGIQALNLAWCAETDVSELGFILPQGQTSKLGESHVTHFIFPVNESLIWLKSPDSRSYSKNLFSLPARVVDFLPLLREKTDFDSVIKNLVSNPTISVIKRKINRFIGLVWHRDGTTPKTLAKIKAK